MIHNFSFKNVFKQLRKLGTGQNWTKKKLHSETDLHEGTNLHKDSFATMVNYVRVTVMHERKINAEKKYIKKAGKT